MFNSWVAQRAGLVVAAWLLLGADTLHAAPAVEPEALAFYYGQPSAVNAARGDVDAAADVFAEYAVVVVGDGLQWPQFTGAAGQRPHYGCEQNSHPDHDSTRAIIERLRNAGRGTQVFGYIPIGGDNTARTCDDGPAPLSDRDIARRIDAWQAMGVVGVFLDEAGYDFGTSRARLNRAVERIHEASLRVFVNAFEPDDVFGDAVTQRVRFSAGARAGERSREAMNPNGGKSLLDDSDVYLLESYQIVQGQFQEPADWTRRAEAAKAYAERFGTRIATVTTPGTPRSSATSCAEVSHPKQLDYAWWSTLLYGFDYFAWGEPDGFSASGVCADRLPFRPRPSVGPLGEFTSPVMPPSGGESGLYVRETSLGVVTVDTDSHEGGYERVEGEAAVRLPATSAAAFCTLLLGLVWFALRGRGGSRSGA